MSTVGFGDVSAVTTEERLFGICAMIIGAGIFAYGITNIVAIVANLTADEASFRHRMDEVNEYMNARELPNDLRLEIREFMYNMRKSEHKKLDIETEVLSEISSMLRSKVALAINDHFLAKMPFFIGSDPNFLMELSLSMRMICFAALEDVVVEGEIGNEMFFIFRGAVEVLKHGEQIMILGENQYFGELAMLNPDCKRLATIRTLCFCELRLLSRVKFIEAMVRCVGFSKSLTYSGMYFDMFSKCEISFSRRTFLKPNQESVPTRRCEPRRFKKLNNGKPMALARLRAPVLETSGVFQISRSCM